MLGFCSTYSLVSPAWPNALTCLIISLPWFLTAITHMSIESLSKRMLPPSPTSLEPFTCCVTVTVYILQKQMSFETLSTRCSLPILPFWGLFTHSSLFFWWSGLFSGVYWRCLFARLLLFALMPDTSRVQLKCADRTMVVGKFLH